MNVASNIFETQCCSIDLLKSTIQNRRKTIIHGHGDTPLPLRKQLQLLIQFNRL